MRTYATETGFTPDIQDIRARLEIVSSEIRFLEGSNAVTKAETAEIRHHLDHITEAINALGWMRRAA